MNVKVVNAGHKLLRPCFFHHAWLGLLTTISYDTSFHISDKMFRLLEKCVSGRTDGTTRTNRMACASTWFKTLRFIFWGYLKSTLYITGASAVQGLQEQTQNRYEMIHKTYEILQRVRISLFRHVTYSAEAAQGGNFERFILSSASRNSETMF